MLTMPLTTVTVVWDSVIVSLGHWPRATKRHLLLPSLPLHHPPPQHFLAITLLHNKGTHSLPSLAFIGIPFDNHQCCQSRFQLNFAASFALTCVEATPHLQ